MNYAQDLVPVLAMISVACATVLLVAVMLPVLMFHQVGAALWIAAGAAGTFAIAGPILLSRLPWWPADFLRGGLLELVLYVSTVWALTIIWKAVQTVRLARSYRRGQQLS